MEKSKHKAPDTEKLIPRLMVQELWDQDDWNRVGKLRMKKDESTEVTMDQTPWSLILAGWK